MEPSLEVEKYRWLSAKTKPDLLSLEDDLQEMPELIRMCGEITAEANSKVNDAKANYKETRSWVAGKLRKAPLPSSKSRSESQIESELDSIKEVMDATKLLNSTQRDAGLWESLMDSLKSKSYAIGSSIELIKCGYLSQDYILAKRHEEIRKGPPK